MANTRQSAKRAKQSVKRRARNNLVRGKARSAFKKAYDFFINASDKGKADLEMAKSLYRSAVSSMTRAGQKHGLPKQRAARKISRLTKLAKSKLPEAVTSTKSS